MTTALVTGATAGLGAAFARALAAERRDLVLVARDADRLAATAKELTEKYHVDVEVLAADLVSDEGCALVEARLADAARPIELLVNNAGIGLRSGFVENSIDDEERMLRLNVRAVMRLTHAALPGMIERGHGDVLNVSSVAAFAPIPELATYAASKAFLFSFSEALRTELKDSGVTVTALLPGPTETEFFERADMEDTKVGSTDKKDDPDEVAKDGFEALMAGKDRVVAGSLKNKVQAGMASVTPDDKAAAMMQGMTKPGSGE